MQLNRELLITFSVCLFLIQNFAAEQNESVMVEVRTAATFKRCVGWTAGEGNFWALEKV